MRKLLGRLCLFLLPVALYLALFVAFEPYNYFGLRAGATDTNQPIYRVRSYLQQPENVIFLGDSRMAHLDMELAGEILGTPCSNLAFGGASEQEMIDLFWFAAEENPNLERVYLEVSFYTMNRYYDKDRAGNIRTVAENPLAYMLNLSYNLEMLANLKNTLTGTAPAIISCWEYSAKEGENTTALSPASRKVLGNMRIMSEEPAPATTFSGDTPNSPATADLKPMEESSG